ncbi:YheC/YheD family protein [Bacillus sp. BRMEA1]|uniref:YheC/YheD family endospore coat-associated protein n=1 Tax=Neobacillus endophyticus TaxID=2738405 RepID=UPI0015673C5C|nr:YheC/YheD family protein [Neobacillus endophyticus]NRD78345.1 YheC/YheD family protein [Neobacillus endophyticus]
MRPTISITVIPRKSDNQSDSLVQISRQVISQLHININNSEALKIALGGSIINAKIQEIDQTAAEIHIPETVLLELKLPFQRYKFKVCYYADLHLLQLGPVIALLTNFTVSDNKEPHFRSVHKFCEELHHGISESGGFFYVFSYGQFPKNAFYLDNGKWLSAKLPLPDVIYNRIHSRKLEKSHSFNQFREQLQTLAIPMFNDRFLSKWDVYEQIIQEDSLVPYIPETRIFSKSNLLDLVQKYESVFMKPVNGSQGRNIIKLFKIGENQYTFLFTLTDSLETGIRKLILEDLYEQIMPLLQNRIYLLQQGITFASYDARTMDFRVLCHKNSLHQWVVTSIVARVAAQGEFVSNLAKGGMILKPLKALKTVFSQKTAFEAYRNMKELALKVAETVSYSEQGITGELGIDLGIDMNGKPWLIEVNSKPSKEFEDSQSKIRPSAQAIIQFCNQLAFERKFE